MGRAVPECDPSTRFYGTCNESIRLVGCAEGFEVWFGKY
jgi:hypothetical protein